MVQLNIFFMVSARQGHQRLSEQRMAELAQFTQTSFQHSLAGADVVVKHAFLEHSRALIGQIYIRDVSWPHFFQAVRHTKGAIEETGVSVDQFVLGVELPPHEFLRKVKGAWVHTRSLPQEWQEEAYLFLKEYDARPVYEPWFVLPFSDEEPSEDADLDYESCSSEEALRFGARVNGSQASRGIPAGLRVRLVEGARLQDYVSTHYAKALRNSESLGGSNIVLTTMLQMNDKLELVNYYSERLRHSERLNLYSLAAMNLHVTDERDENDVANLVANDRLIVRDIVLGV